MYKLSVEVVIMFGIIIAQLSVSKVFIVATIVAIIVVLRTWKLPYFISERLEIGLSGSTIVRTINMTRPTNMRFFE